MQRGIKRVGIAALAASTLAIGTGAFPAFADYAPNAKDAVGVGSDTVQYAIDFMADGDPAGDTGYNTTAPKYRVVNFDATADVNARLAYGPNGTSDNSNSACEAGTGTTKGTGNQTLNHKDQPCVLNPTVVLREGLFPVQRPNGSGDGAKALLGDVTNNKHYIDFARSSSDQGPTAGGGSGTLGTASFDDIVIGQDPLNLLTAGTGSKAVQLSNNQLKTIYNAAAPNCVKWSDVGGSSTDFIVPVLPQIGSGTRSSFLGAIGVTNPGTCVVTSEENDPTAVNSAPALFNANTAFTTAPTTTAVDTITPMSGGRLNLFKGLLGSNGATNGVGGFFQDPSCKYGQSSSTGTNASNGQPNAACVSNNAANLNNTINPDVALITSTFNKSTATGDTTSGSTSVNVTAGTVTANNVNNLITGAGIPSGTTIAAVSGTTVTLSAAATATATGVALTVGGAPSDNGTLFGISRPLYIYFKHADINAAGWQPGSINSIIRTLFYNPCDTTGAHSVNCTTTTGPDGNPITYGPGGAPYIAGPGQALISAAGINPTYHVDSPAA